MNKKKYLTKSKFKAALECPCKLFYYDRKKEYANLNAENDFLQALAEGGYQVGELAKLYYPGGYDIKSLDYDKSLEETNKLLKKDNVIIYEAAIKYKSCFVRVDILKKTGNSIQLIEVKAKSFNPENEELVDKSGYICSKWKSYLYDVAFQNWVAKKSFPNFCIDPFLLVADKSQKTTVKGLNQIFKISKNAGGRIEIKLPENINEIDLGQKILVPLNVKDIVERIWNGTDIKDDKKTGEELKSFEERIYEYSDYYCSDTKYPVTIGQKCKKCEYKNTENTQKAGLKSGFEDCWQKACGKNFDFNKPNIFEVWNFRKGQELIDSNIYYMENIPKDYFLNESGLPKSTSTARQLLQIEKTLNDPTESINPILYKEMEEWKFPLHFIDFETSMTAIPFSKDKKPYEQLAFQFSSHTLYEDGTILHDEYLHDKVGKFPNFDFVKALMSVLNKDNGTIFRYAAHENTVLRQIQQQMIDEDANKYDQLIAWIDTVTQWQEGKEKLFGERNMVDLQRMVVNYYYHPRMKGSNSIKVVLPAILSASDFIKSKYSEPLPFGTHLKNKILWQLKTNSSEPENPYKLLDPIFKDIDAEQIEHFFDGSVIKEGGAAATAYARMQFSEMSDTERQALRKSLLSYCELDTLAMLMIYEHWSSSKNKKGNGKLI